VVVEDGLRYLMISLHEVLFRSRRFLGKDEVTSI